MCRLSKNESNVAKMRNCIQGLRNMSEAEAVTRKALLMLQTIKKMKNVVKESHGRVQIVDPVMVSAILKESGRPSFRCPHPIQNLL